MSDGSGVVDWAKSQLTDEDRGRLKSYRAEDIDFKQMSGDHLIDGYTNLGAFGREISDNEMQKVKMLENLSNASKEINKKNAETRKKQ